MLPRIGADTTEGVVNLAGNVSGNTVRAADAIAAAGVKGTERIATSAIPVAASVGETAAGIVERVTTGVGEGVELAGKAAGTARDHAANTLIRSKNRALDRRDAEANPDVSAKRKEVALQRALSYEKRRLLRQALKDAKRDDNQALRQIKSEAKRARRGADVERVKRRAEQHARRSRQRNNYVNKCEESLEQYLEQAGDQENSLAALERVQGWESRADVDKVLGSLDGHGKFCDIIGNCYTRGSTGRVLPAFGTKRR
jgi:hypothetical protein